MASAKYFTKCDGQVELANAAYSFRKDEFVGKLYDGQRFVVCNLFSKKPQVTIDWTQKTRHHGLYAAGTCPGCGRAHLAERVIYRPSQASNHVCSGICMNAKSGTCECSCGGANHGAGNC